MLKNRIPNGGGLVDFNKTPLLSLARFLWKTLVWNSTGGVNGNGAVGNLWYKCYIVPIKLCTQASRKTGIEGWPSVFKFFGKLVGVPILVAIGLVLGVLDALIKSPVSKAYNKGITKGYSKGRSIVNVGLLTLKALGGAALLVVLAVVSPLVGLVGKVSEAGLSNSLKEVGTGVLNLVAAPTLGLACCIFGAVLAPLVSSVGKALSNISWQNVRHTLRARVWNWKSGSKWSVPFYIAAAVVLAVEVAFSPLIFIVGSLILYATTSDETANSARTQEQTREEVIDALKNETKVLLTRCDTFDKYYVRKRLSGSRKTKANITNAYDNPKDKEKVRHEKLIEVLNARGNRNDAITTSNASPESAVSPEAYDAGVKEDPMQFSPEDLWKGSPSQLEALMSENARIPQDWQELKTLETQSNTTRVKEAQAALSVLYNLVPQFREGNNAQAQNMLRRTRAGVSVEERRVPQRGHMEETKNKAAQEIELPASCQSDFLNYPIFRVLESLALYSGIKVESEGKQPDVVLRSKRRFDENKFINKKETCQDIIVKMITSLETQLGSMLDACEQKGTSLCKTSLEYKEVEKLFESIAELIKRVSSNSPAQPKKVMTHGNLLRCVFDAPGGSIAAIIPAFKAKKDQWQQIKFAADHPSDRVTVVAPPVERATPTPLPLRRVERARNLQAAAAVMRSANLTGLEPVDWATFTLADQLQYLGFSRLDTSMVSSQAFIAEQHAIISQERCSELEAAVRVMERRRGVTRGLGFDVNKSEAADESSYLGAVLRMYSGSRRLASTASTDIYETLKLPKNTSNVSTLCDLLVKTEITVKTRDDIQRLFKALIPASAEWCEPQDALAAVLTVFRVQYLRKTVREFIENSSSLVLESIIERHQARFDGESYKAEFPFYDIVDLKVIIDVEKAKRFFEVPKNKEHFIDFHSEYRLPSVATLALEDEGTVFEIKDIAKLYGGGDLGALIDDAVPTVLFVRPMVLEASNVTEIKCKAKVTINNVEYKIAGATYREHASVKACSIKEYGKEPRYFTGFFLYRPGDDRVERVVLSTSLSSADNAPWVPALLQILQCVDFKKVAERSLNVAKRSLYDPIEDDASESIVAVLPSDELKLKGPGMIKRPAAAPRSSVKDRLIAYFEMVRQNVDIKRDERLQATKRRLEAFQVQLLGMLGNDSLTEEMMGDMDDLLRHIDETLGWIQGELVEASSRQFYAKPSSSPTSSGSRDFRLLMMDQIKSQDMLVEQKLALLRKNIEEPLLLKFDTGEGWDASDETVFQSIEQFKETVLFDYKWAVKKSKSDITGILHILEGILSKMKGSDAGVVDGYSEAELDKVVTDISASYKEEAEVIGKVAEINKKKDVLTSGTVAYGLGIPIIQAERDGECCFHCMSIALVMNLKKESSVGIDFRNTRTYLRLAGLAQPQRRWWPTKANKQWANVKRIIDHYYELRWAGREITTSKGEIQTLISSHIRKAVVESADEQYKLEAGDTESVFRVQRDASYPVPNYRRYMLTTGIYGGEFEMTVFKELMGWGLVTQTAWGLHYDDMTGSVLAVTNRFGGHWDVLDITHSDTQPASKRPATLGLEVPLTDIAPSKLNTQPASKSPATLGLAGPSTNSHFTSQHKSVRDALKNKEPKLVDNPKFSSDDILYLLAEAQTLFRPIKYKLGEHNVQLAPLHEKGLRYSISLFSDNRARSDLTELLYKSIPDGPYTKSPSRGGGVPITLKAPLDPSIVQEIKLDQIQADNTASILDALVDAFSGNIEVKRSLLLNQMILECLRVLTGKKAEGLVAFLQKEKGRGSEEAQVIVKKYFTFSEDKGVITVELNPELCLSCEEFNFFQVLKRQFNANHICEVLYKGCFKIVTGKLIFTLNDNLGLNRKQTRFQIEAAQAGIIDESEV